MLQIDCERAYTKRNEMHLLMVNIERKGVNYEHVKSNIN